MVPYCPLDDAFFSYQTPTTLFDLQSLRHSYDGKVNWKQLCVYGYVNIVRFISCIMLLLLDILSLCFVPKFTDSGSAELSPYDVDILDYIHTIPTFPNTCFSEK